MTPLTLKERFQLSRFFSGEKPTDEPVRLNHRRIFILPSQRGLGFVVLIALLLLIAFVYNNNLTYLLAFLLASIFFITILHSFKALSGLILHAGQCKPVFAGESAVFEIHLDNPGTSPKENITLALFNTVDLVLPPRSKVSARLFSPTRHRGWHQCGTVTVGSRFPLGLFRAWSPVRFALKTIVYPKPLAHETPFPLSVDSSLPDGSVKQGVDDFYGLQAYQKGDSIKHIHWKAYAKGQGLYSRQYSGEQGSELWLSYEATGGHDPEEKLSQLCRWILDAEKAGRHYGLSVPGLKIEPGIGQAHRSKCLEALALF